MSTRFEVGRSWAILSPIEQSIKRKIEAVGKPLKEWDVKIYRGILTGCNEAFIIDGARKDELIAQDPKSAEIIRPILRGRDIKRYGYDFADLYLLWVPWHFPYHLDRSISGASMNAEMAFKTGYPAVYAHLLKFKDQLASRNQSETGKRYEWYALQRWGANYWEDFNRQKIIYSEITDIPNFALDKKGEYYINNKAFMICLDKHICYLYHYLNSIFCERYFNFIASTTGAGTIQWFKYKIEEVPIPDINSLTTSDKSVYTTGAPNQLNTMWCSLFKFDDKEINYFRELSINSISLLSNP